MYTITGARGGRPVAEPPPHTPYLLLLVLYDGGLGEVHPRRPLRRRQPRAPLLLLWGGAPGLLVSGATRDTWQHTTDTTHPQTRRRTRGGQSINLSIDARTLARTHARTHTDATGGLLLPRINRRTQTGGWLLSPCPALFLLLDLPGGRGRGHRSSSWPRRSSRRCTGGSPSPVGGVGVAVGCRVLMGLDWITVCVRCVCTRGGVFGDVCRCWGVGGGFGLDFCFLCV